MIHGVKLLVEVLRKSPGDLATKGKHLWGGKTGRLQKPSEDHAGLCVSVDIMGRSLDWSHTSLHMFVRIKGTK